VTTAIDREFMQQGAAKAAALLRTVGNEQRLLVLCLLIDQGEADEFLPQLRPELLRAACDAAGHPLTLRLHPGYDHGYYFIASFIADHVAHHARALRG